MDDHQLDEVDKQLLELLQENARYSATNLAERIGVSDNTIHNRMKRLEDANIITDYRAIIDPHEVGLRLYFLFTCTARISERGTVAEQARAIPEIVEVTELMTGQNNLQIKVVGAENEDITRIAQQLDDLALEVNDENLIREEHSDVLDPSVMNGTSED